MTKPNQVIAQTNNFIVLDSYKRTWQQASSYQTEQDLENELLRDLQYLGYELAAINNQQSMLANVRQQIQTLNNVEFADVEWQRFVESYLDNANDNLCAKAKKVHHDAVCDFVFDDKRVQNIHLFDKQNLSRNKLQVIRQFEQGENRYDVSILVNGLPLVHIELKKRGVKIKEAFNQVHRYSKESFNSENSLYTFVQLFVISNGTDSRYFANTTTRNINSFEFTMNWAQANNSTIKDLKDFTATFLQKNTLLNVLFNYSVLDCSDTLLVMRPYQIAASERILWKIHSAYNAKQFSSTQGGGYVWHTTGSGKTLTSFKVAQLASKIDFIDKVMFVVDRKDLDFQTIKEYKRFAANSILSSSNTIALKDNLENSADKIVVTTIQKLNTLLQKESNLSIYDKHVVLIFDECHRSQFGKAQANIKKKFKKYFQFGFTGTPIFSENALSDKTTQSVFGNELHAYTITDAIRDNKVLKFKVDYNNVRPNFKHIETVDAFENQDINTQEMLLQDARIKEISKYILNNFAIKTRRKNSAKGFNAMFAVFSVKAAKKYYECFKELQANSEKKLKIATIFSYAANEEQNAVGDIADEEFVFSTLDSSSKEFLTMAINDYNAMFGCSHSVDNSQFQNYYRDLSERVKKQEVDLLIVVNMFLTGFDAPTLNTLFVDKSLRYHGLIQAYSRTNRIFDSSKAFGNVVTFLDLETETNDALKLFGAKDDASVVIEKSFFEYIHGFLDSNGKKRQGFIAISKELKTNFPAPDAINSEADKKQFVKLFGKYLRIKNILENYDEFTVLQDLQNLDLNDAEAVAEFKANNYLDDEKFDEFLQIEVIDERSFQDYLSVYQDIREWIRDRKDNDSQVDWSDVVFEIELLKSQEIGLDYILNLMLQIDKNNLLWRDKILSVINASNSRGKKAMLLDFMDKYDISAFEDIANITDAFVYYARAIKQQEVSEMIREYNLHADKTRAYLNLALERGYLSDLGGDLNDIIPRISPLNPAYKESKDKVSSRIKDFIDKFSGIGGRL